MKVNIKKILKEEIIKETAERGDSLLNNGIILVTDNTKYVLYNYSEEQVIAYSSMIHLKTGYYMGNGIAAEQGYGPVIYDIMMMNIFPNEIRCDDSITPAGIAMFDFYYNRRPDVIKTPMPQNTITDLLRYDDEALLYSYRQESKPWFKSLKIASNEVIKQNQLNIHEILIDGENYFNNRYGDYFN